ncbi:MAG: diphthine--ammonia ligase [Candidatus Caldatribacteriaceae bacterium]
MLKAFASFSGGKDSHLSIYKAKEAGFEVQALLSMAREDEGRSASHHIPVDILRRQSAAMGIPLFVYPTSWEAYEINFLKALKELKEKGITSGIFGDIDVLEHREWVERVCQKAGIDPFLPLWGKDHKEVAEEVVRLDFEAYITVVKDGVLPREYLGRRYDKVLIEELLSQGVDPCGEEGEFHTLVTFGPLYRHPVSCTFSGYGFDGKYHFLEVR